MHALPRLAGAYPIVDDAVVSPFDLGTNLDVAKNPARDSQNLLRIINKLLGLSRYCSGCGSPRLCIRDRSVSIPSIRLSTDILHHLHQILYMI
jgi:hypothetical protein